MADLPIRDEIALRVLVALISSPAQIEAAMRASTTLGEPPRVHASRLAYAYADSMLAARDGDPARTTPQPVSKGRVPQ